MGWLGDVLAWFTDPANWTGPNGILVRLYQHILVSLVALVICARSRCQSPSGSVTSVAAAASRSTSRTWAARSRRSRSWSCSPWDRCPVSPSSSTIVALVLFGLPPLLTNAYVGMREVDRDVVEAARGMGMRAGQMLRQVELPLAAPLILTGLRTAAVQIVATATIAAIVGGPGLGSHHHRGTRQPGSGATCLGRIDRRAARACGRVQHGGGRAGRRSGASGAAWTATAAHTGDRANHPLTAIPRSPLHGAWARWTP